MYLYDDQRANAMGEYGGIGLVLKDHIWEPNRNWGYIQFSSPDEVTDEYIKYAKQLMELARKGFTAAVYTQTTDVEIEVNGLVDFNRNLKVNIESIKKLNDMFN